jgi:mannosyltransferase OCH1-like enzyme
MVQIPKIIHQTWKTDRIPKKFQSYVAGWQSFHPDWDYKFWTDKDIRKFFIRYYPWFMPQFNGYKRQIERIDAFRYFLLHQFGGFYIDIDFECLKPLDPLLNGHQCILGTEPSIHAKQLYQKDQVICNAILASVPDHPFWEHVFSLLKIFKNKQDVIESTGPLLLQQACSTYPPKDISIFPETVFCPLVDLASKRLQLSTEDRACYLKMIQDKRYPAESYAVHHWAGSWHRWDMGFFVRVLRNALFHIATGNFYSNIRYFLFYVRIMLKGKRLYDNRDTPVAVDDGVIISLTTIPSRIHNIFPTLNSLLLQSRPAEKIYLNLPELSVREKCTYQIPAILRDDKRISINRCKEDYGPLTKLLPVLDLVKQPDTIIITVDDDMVYHPDMIKTMMKYHDRFPQVVLGFRGWNIPTSGLYEDSKTIFSNQTKKPRKVDILTGVSGVLYLRKHFKGDFFERDNLPREGFFVDDICINGYLKKKSVKRYLIPSPIREPLGSYIRTSRSNPLWKINKTGKNNQKMINYFFKNKSPIKKEPCRLLRFYRDKVYKFVYPIYDEFFHTCNHYFGKKKAKSAVRRQVLLQLLTALDLYFKSAQITYWLDWGTLLGCYREKKMIPYRH